MLRISTWASRAFCITTPVDTTPMPVYGAADSLKLSVSTCFTRSIPTRVRIRFSVACYTTYRIPYLGPACSIFATTSRLCISAAISQSQPYGMICRRCERMATTVLTLIRILLIAPQRIRAYFSQHCVLSWLPWRCNAGLGYSILLRYVAIFTTMLFRKKSQHVTSHVLQLHFFCPPFRGRPCHIDLGGIAVRLGVSSVAGIPCNDVSSPNRAGCGE